MKTKEELNALKNEVEALNAKLAELTEDELKQVSGGVAPFTVPKRDCPESWTCEKDPNTCYKHTGTNPDPRIPYFCSRYLGRS